MRAIESFDPDADHSIYARVRERYPNTGKPWTEQSDQELRRLLSPATASPISQSTSNERANGIRARLVKLGLLDPREFKSRFIAA